MYYASSPVQRCQLFHPSFFEHKRKYVWNSTGMNEIVGFLFPSLKEATESTVQGKIVFSGFSGTFTCRCAQGHTVTHQYCSRHTRFLQGLEERDGILQSHLCAEYIATNLEHYQAGEKSFFLLLFLAADVLIYELQLLAFPSLKSVLCGSEAHVWIFPPGLLFLIGMV